MSGKTRKAVLASFVLVILIASTLPLISSGPVDSETAYGGTDTSGWADVSNTIPGSGAISGNYILNGNATLTGTLTVAKDVSVNIDLNGYTIIAAVGSRVFDVTGTLIIQDYAHRSGTGVGSIMGQGTVTGNGGCIIINSGGTVNLNDIAIGSFSVDGNGGAIHVASGATLNMYGAVIGDPSAVTRSDITLEGVVNSASPWANHMSGSSGNISGGQGGGICALGTFTMYRGKICGNVSLTGTQNQGGGGLYIGSGSNVSILSGEFTNNVGNSGGAIYSNGIPTIGSEGRFVLFESNVASVGKNNGGCGNGGAIYLAKDSGSGTSPDSISFINSSFKNNISARFGGAIEIQDTTVSTINYSDCDFISNHSISQPAGALVIDNSSDSLTVNISNGSVFKDNVSGYYLDGSSNVNGKYGGGAIYFYKGNIILNLFDTEIYNNKASQGGAVYCLNQCTAAKITGGFIHDNYSTGAGGAIYVDAELTLDSNPADLSNNLVRISKNSSGGNGGAVYVAKTFKMNAGLIENNGTSGNGGAVYISSGGFTMKGGDLKYNKASNGGAIYVYRGSFLISDGSIIYNEAVGNGGAVVVESGTIQMDGGTIGYNTAGNAGAILCQADATLNGGQIIDNKATQNMDIHLKKTASSTPNLIIDGTTVRNNTLTSEDTVTINVEGGCATFTSGLIKYNLIDADGDSQLNDVAAKMSVGGTIKVIGADIVNCKVTIGDTAYLYCSSQGRLSDGNVEIGSHIEVKQYYTENSLYAFVMVPTSDSSNAISTIIDKDILTAAGVNEEDRQKWYTVWTGQSESNAISMSATISSLSGNGNVMYSVNTVTVQFTLKFDADGGSLSGEGFSSTLTFSGTGGSITFAQGSGSSTISTNGTTSSYSFTVSAIKTDYVFAGWSIGGSGTVMTNGNMNLSDLFSKDHTVTLYAHWVPIGYTIIYNPNGGSGSQMQVVTTETTVTLDSTYSGVRDGFIFVGWNTSNDGKGTHYATGQECNLGLEAGSTVILFAQWIKPSYSGSLEIGSASS